MITKKVNRYYCEFCGKSGCNAAYIKIHEEHCTLNPHRTCNVCRTFLDQEQPDLGVIIGRLPMAQVGLWHGEEDSPALTDRQIMEGIAMLREATGDCPACILAALRQKDKHYAPLFYNTFDFKRELEKLRLDWNEEQQRKDAIACQGG
jgi:hypothetical protein